MVLTGTSIRAAGAACLLALAGCVWVEEDNPSATVVPLPEHALQRVWSDTVPSAEGIFVAETGDIAAFLGTRDFRIAVTATYLPSGFTSMYMLNPEADTAPPAAIRFHTIGEGFNSRYEMLDIMDCSFSPGGDALVYSRGPSYYRGNPDVYSYYPRTLWMLTLGENRWLVPLTSRANRSQGMLGGHPFWRLADGKPRIAFAGFAAGPQGKGFQVQEMREVEKTSDSSVSPVEPLRIGGGMAGEIVVGLSRDGRWAHLQKTFIQTGGVKRDFLIPVARLSDSAFLADPDSMRPYSAGPDASLNPFDSSRSDHTDYYLTRPFLVFGGDSGKDPDTLHSPRTLEGVPGTDRAHAQALWLCDKDRRIILSQDLPDLDGGGINWVRWTNHPNFVLANRGGIIYIVKLAADAGTLLANPETATLRAAGVFRLISNLAGGYSSSASEATLWMGEAP